MWIIVVLIAIILVLLWVVRLNTFLDATLPPSPFRLPLVGHLHLLDPATPHHGFAALCKRFGGIVGLQFGSVYVVALSDPTLVREAMVKQGPNFANRPRLPLLDILSGRGEDMVMSDFTPRVRELRKVTHQLFLGNALVRGHDVQIVETLHADVLPALRAAAAAGVEADVRSIIKCFSLNLLSLNLMGVRFGSTSDPNFQTVLASHKRCVQAGGQPRDLFTLLKLFLTASAANPSDYLKFLAPFFRHILRDAAASLAVLDESLLVTLKRARSNFAAGDDEANSVYEWMIKNKDKHSSNDEQVAVTSC